MASAIGFVYNECMMPPEQLSICTTHWHAYVGRLRLPTHFLLLTCCQLHDNCKRSNACVQLATLGYQMLYAFVQRGQLAVHVHPPKHFLIAEHLLSVWLVCTQCVDPSFYHHVLGLALAAAPSAMGYIWKIEQMSDHRVQQR